MITLSGFPKSFVLSFTILGIPLLSLVPFVKECNHISILLVMIPKGDNEFEAHEESLFDYLGLLLLGMGKLSTCLLGEYVPPMSIKLS